MPLEELDCDLGPPHPGYQCNTPPLLDLEWRIFDGTKLVKNWPAEPIRAGKRNGHFTLEVNVRNDAGRLKDLHPRVQIVKTLVIAAGCRGEIEGTVFGT